ncbi:hypothetical protein J1N35_007745 [Gossypium stocksii]|uniref:AMP-binding enzyme C-terminal domain-containing protein n=1 Tax=Gossypium stocksii TaxID=47602 RepID=A0A9D3W7G5_9ROSI|nr:hypothetical protein J1N35_007745 [Gossypium stocksii]
MSTVGLTEADVLDLKTGEPVRHDVKTIGEVVLRGVIHQDGYLEINYRSKDIIISDGENINSPEIESVLYSHPAVNEAAVGAKLDKFWGETLCYCRDMLPHCMVPKTVVFESELPETSMGKVQNFILRRIAKAMS